MKALQLLLRLVVKLGASAVLLAAGLGLIALLMRPNLRAPKPDYPAEEIEAVLRARDVSFDPETDAYALYVDVDYTKGATAPWYPRGESPVLAELVAAGELPPVAERVGPEPAVLRGVEGIGRHGGSWYRVASSEGDVGVMTWRIGGARLTRWSPLGYPVVPHLARGWTVSDDMREYTVHLRRGVRWSDGHPFTARDILYWWEHEVLFYESFPHSMVVGGELGEIEKIDEYTVLFRFRKPFGLFPERMASSVFWSPAHYLEQFHPERGDTVKIERMMQIQGVQSPRISYFALKSWRNPELPSLNPWILREHQRSAPYSFVRNPYFWAVDPQGNQLPYIDRVVNDIRSEDMIAITAAAGDISMQMRHIRFEDHSLYMDSRRAGGYDVFFWSRSERSAFAVFPNINRRVEEQRPETRWKRKILGNKRFRQALSLAINRRDIIRAEYADLVEPAQLDPGKNSPFHHPGLYKAFIDYDPERAERLLDEIGLDQRDREGYRTFPDGSRMVFFLNVADFTGIGPSQFLIEDWSAVGVRVILRLNARSLWQLQQSTLQHDLSVWTGESEFLPLVEPRNFVPTARHSFYAPGFAFWYLAGGLYGSERAETRSIAIEPPHDHPLRRAMEVLEEARAQGDLDDQVEVFREALDIAAENLWSINLATPPPQPVIVQNGFRNVPRKAITGARVGTPSNAGVETYFFEEPEESPGAREAISEAIRRVVPDPRLTLSADSPARDNRDSPARCRMAGLLRFLWRAILLAALVLLLIRRPFIARRILILVPTILIISVIVFTIIQLPPGDYISARIEELEMDGDPAALQQIEELRDLFHLDDPQVIRYFRWMGLPWFRSFDPADRGLLQGDLGRSMEDGRRVNEIVGDRIALTMLISLFTIIFTWLLAVPIGLYSAVRQYSPGDYLFTFLGFIGMCVPNMLLALLLMYIGSTVFNMPVGGLFSPEYALQPEWTWGKFVDLLQHIWVPVLVLGSSSTAGMIRVLRANLLDELDKPYVITARAKGVRPLRLLLKYPLRLALNPFISGIGNIFPMLVSGGAIVGIVLSLPTVGPLQLTALQSQNMYLAGSMLMVLSLLTVLGTLVSDLLLMWVDPRIRMGGKEAA